MTQKIRTLFKSEKNSQFPDNSVGTITAARLREQMDHLADSAAFPEDFVGNSLLMTASERSKLAGLDVYTHPNHTGDVTSLGEGATTISANAVTNTKLQDMANGTIKARITAGTGDPEDATPTQVAGILPNFTSAAKGVVPASGGGTTNFLRADGLWVSTPGAAGIADGDKGDITVSGGGDSWSIDPGVVTFSKMANLTTSTIIGRATAGTGSPEALTPTQVKTILNLTGTNSGDQTITLTGDVVGSGTSSFATTISSQAITNTKLATVPTNTIKGRLSAGTGVVEDLSSTQATAILDTFSSTVKGLTPPSGGGSVNYLRADGTWVSPPGNAGFADSRLGVYNITGSTIVKGSPVYISGYNSGTSEVQISLADSDGSGTGPAIGVTSADILTATSGIVILSGKVTALNTNTLALNAPLYVSSTGTLTNIPPTTGYIQEVARVSRVSATVGEIIVNAKSLKALTIREYPASDEVTPLIVGTNKFTFRVATAFILREIRASVSVAPTGTTRLAVDVNKNGTSILSTKLTFDASEKTTATSSIPAVISDVNLTDDAEITIDIDAVGSTIAGTGLKLYFIGYTPE